MNHEKTLLADARSALAPGSTLTIGAGALRVTIAPEAGGRIAQIARDGVDHLVGYGRDNAAMIAWGCYPMVPWAGRIRDGRFAFAGGEYSQPRNLDQHAIHGVGFALPWCVDGHEVDAIDLSLALPVDRRWPFGGTARQRIRVSATRLELGLSVEAGETPMPAVIGWHPWFRKPDRIDFLPRAMYPGDAAGIATLPLADPAPGPWDDCFIHHGPVVLHIDRQRLRLSSDCDHWVVYDETAHATCVEPQSGPPDAFNLTPHVVLAPGQTLRRTFTMDWSSD